MQGPPIAVLLGTWLAVAAGCADETALLLEITSPLEVPGEIDQVELHVLGLGGGSELSRSFVLTEPFPHSFTLFPSDPDEEVRITLTASRSGGPDPAAGERSSVRRVVRARFHRGSELQVPIELYPACLGVRCGDGVDCIGGRCASGSSSMTPPPDEGLGCAADEECDDRDPCNGRERCEDGTCLSTGEESCDDGVACTVDGCDAAACTHRPDDRACLSGDRCDPSAGCGGRPCGSDADCDDGLLCNGQETCVDASCRPGRALRCDDDVACTRDRCDESRDGCVHEPDDTICDDGFLCNGAERCQLDTGCRAGAAATCDDGDGCTDDACDGAGAGACDHTTRDIDGDGHGDAACASRGIPAGDCDDRDASVHEGAPESCDGRDEDCDGRTDESCSAGCGTSCPGAVAVAAPGGRHRLALRPGAEMGSCGGAGSEAVLSFTLAETSDVFVTTHGSAVDTVLYVRGCSCGGSEVACNDNANGLRTSLLTLVRLAPGTYNVFADTHAAMSAEVQVDLYISPPAGGGHRCGRARFLSTAPRTDDTCAEESGVSGGCGHPDSLAGPDHVYFVVVTGARRTVTFDTCSGCTRFDSTLLLRSHCDGPAATRIACSDDGCGSACIGATTLQSTMRVDLDPGLYYLFVDGRGAACGPYTVTATGL